MHILRNCLVGVTETMILPYSNVLFSNTKNHGFVVGGLIWKKLAISLCSLSARISVAVRKDWLDSFFKDILLNLKVVEARSQRGLCEHTGCWVRLVGWWVGTEAYLEYASNHGIDPLLPVAAPTISGHICGSKNQRQTYRSYENVTAPKFVVKPLQHSIKFGR